MSNEKREKRKNWVEKLDRKTKIMPNIKNRVSTDEKNKKIFNLTISISDYYALEIVIASLKIEKIIPTVKGLKESERTSCGTSACSCHFTLQTGDRKRRRLGQPLDRAERNGAARCVMAVRSIGHGTKVKCVQT